MRALGWALSVGPAHFRKINAPSSPGEGAGHTVRVTESGPVADGADPSAEPDLPVPGAPAPGENATRPLRSAAAVGDDRPVIPDVALDDTDRGWGDDLRDRSGERDEDWYRRERPPHWD